MGSSRLDIVDLCCVCISNHLLLHLYCCPSNSDLLATAL